MQVRRRGCETAPSTSSRDACWDGLKRRGPDCFQVHHFVVGDVGDQVTINVAVSVLHMKGDQTVTPQPIADAGTLLDADWLAFNGEIYDGLHVRRRYYGRRNL